MAKKPSKTKKQSSSTTSQKKTSAPARKKKSVSGKKVDVSTNKKASVSSSKKARSSDKKVRNESKTKPKKIRNFFRRIKEKIQAKRKERINPHKSFRRSYREDYKRKTNVPGVMHHVFASFRVIFKNWKLFLPFLIIVIILNAIFVGMMDQNDYSEYQEILDDTSMQVAGGDIGSVAKAGLTLISTITTGGLSGESSEAAVVFVVLIFLLIWLVTIFLLRHIMAGHKVKLRDGLYNAMAPLVSTLMIFVLAVLQCIPIFLLIIAYSAAMQTEFLATPFYALVFFIFAVLMIALSGYLLSSSLMAFVAVSVPGMYPLRALATASDLMMGRRVKFVLRLIALVLVLVIVWVVVMLPLILFDMWMKQFEWTQSIPFVPICLTTMTCFTCIYLTTYIYKYYRYMLDYNEE